MVAKSAQAGQFVRVLPTPKGELIPLTLADWDAKAGTIDLVIQGVGASSILINQMKVGEAFTGIAGPLGQPSKLHKYDADQTVVFCAGGARSAAGLSDRARASAARQPRHPDRRLPHQGRCCSGRRQASASTSCRRSSASSST